MPVMIVDRAPRRCKCIGIDGTLCRQGIKCRGMGILLAIGAKIRTVVLTGDPNDVGFLA